MRRRIWRGAKLALAAVSALIVLTIAALGFWRWYRHHELAVTTAVDPQTGIDESVVAKIGGVDQWIGIRGRDRRAPILVVLHGGPGFAMSVMGRDVFASWRRDFVVVLWDQRGAGKTYGLSGPLDPSVTIDRMARDGIEVIEFVRARLNQPKVVLVGVSWGSMLGVHIAKARPDLLYAYVGTGQSVNQGTFRPIAYRQLLAEARARNNRRALAELTANGPPPYDTIGRATVHTKWANAFEPGQPSRFELFRMALIDSDAGPRDLRNYVLGVIDSQNHFRDEVERLDAMSLGTDFSVPFFVFQGALDNVTPVAGVRPYFDAVRAPHKDLALIPNAGHNVMATRSDEFLKLLVERVRPFAVAP